jgi:hypothetical protein
VTITGSNTEFDLYLSFAACSPWAVGLAAFVDFEVFTAAVVFLLVVVLRVVAFASEAFFALALALVSTAGASFAGAVFVAVVRVAEAFVVAVRAETIRDVEPFNSEFLAKLATFGAGAVVFVFAVLVVVFTSLSSSASAFFVRPLRVGALLSTLDLSGDSGGVAFVCARCARVRTILGDSLKMLRCECIYWGRSMVLMQSAWQNMVAEQPVYHVPTLYSENKFASFDLQCKTIYWNIDFDILKVKQYLLVYLLFILFCHRSTLRKQWC